MSTHVFPQIYTLLLCTFVNYSLPGSQSSWAEKPGVQTGESAWTVRPLAGAVCSATLASWPRERSQRGGEAVLQRRYRRECHHPVPLHWLRVRSKEASDWVDPVVIILTACYLSVTAASQSWWTEDTFRGRRSDQRPGWRDRLVFQTNLTHQTSHML